MIVPMPDLTQRKNVRRLAERQTKGEEHEGRHDDSDQAYRHVPSRSETNRLDHQCDRNEDTQERA